MIEVFLWGVFVAYSRLVDLAPIEVGPAAWALGGLMLVSVSADIALDPEAAWEAIDGRSPPVTTPTEADANPVGCPRCARLCQPPRGCLGTCPRCGARLWPRKPASLARSWALLLASMIAIVFAYSVPVMTVTHLGRAAPTTIIGGMLELAAMGWWPIAIVVFVASIVIPIFKLVTLAVLLLSVHRRSTVELRSRTRLYRLIERIGRWSMIDVFMVSILTVLVRSALSPAFIPMMACSPSARWCF